MKKLMNTHDSWRYWANDLSEQDWLDFVQENDAVVQAFISAWQTFYDKNYPVATVSIQVATPNAPKNHLNPATELIAPTEKNESSSELMPIRQPENPKPVYELQQKTDLPLAEVANSPTELIALNPEIRQPENPKTVLLTKEPAMPIAPKIIPLPNARCGENYLVTLPESAQDVVFKPDCGLVWDAATQRIHGKPTYSGDVEVRYSLVYGDNVIPTRQTLYINPNPRDLWKNIPSNEKARFAKPDVFCDEIDTIEGKLLAARVRGRSHAHVGTHCDDDFTIRHHLRTNLHLIAVSDGAGSAEFSRLGSQVVVDAVADTVWELLDSQEANFTILSQFDLGNCKRVLTNLTNRAVYCAYTSLHNAAKDEQIPLKQLSCTLLFALSLPMENGQWLTATYSVGDGAVAIWRPEKQQLDFVSKSDGGSYSGETKFLTVEETTEDSLNKRVCCIVSDDSPVLLLMTDGVSDPKFETDAQLSNPQRWADLWAELQTPLRDTQPEKALEAWLDFWSAGNHDDRTLALFVPSVCFRQPERLTELSSSSIKTENAS